MARRINYDGSVVAMPERLVRPRTVAELREIMADRRANPAPVRAVGSFHSLTPCAATSGTMVDMTGMTEIVSIDEQAMTITVQAGLQLIDAAAVLRSRGLQFRLNLEIGNITLGAAACCQTKDGLDAAEYGQANSYATRINWVSPSGELCEATERDPELLALVRSSNGLCGIVYQATFRIKPLEAIRIRHRAHRVEDLTEPMLSDLLEHNQGIVCWTVGRTMIVETRNPSRRARNGFLGRIRRASWSHIAAGVGRAVRQFAPGTTIGTWAEDAWFACERLAYRYASAMPPYTMWNPDKIIDYRRTPRSVRYAFTFWAFPRADWLATFRDYLSFAEAWFKRTGFRCNVPLGTYFIRQDTSSLLSYSYDGDILSIDPIHAPSDRDRLAWEDFLRAYNRWAHGHGGIPLLNQSPFVEREHLAAAYGDRWRQFSAWAKKMDPDGRMVNPFFRDLLD